MRGLVLAALVVVACTPKSAGENATPTATGPTLTAQTTPMATAPIYATASASASTAPAASGSPRLGAATPTAADGPDSCTINAPCPPRVVTMAGGSSTSIPQECCLQPGGADGSQDHLACQDQHSKRPCVHGCVTDSDCPATMKCKPWGKDHRSACAAP